MRNLKFPFIVHFYLFKVELALTEVLLIAYRHLFFVCVLETLEKFCGLWNSWAIFCGFSVTQHLVHFLFDFVIDFFFAVSFNSLKWAQKHLNFLLILFCFLGRECDILIVYRVMIFFLFEHPRKILKLSQFKQGLPKMNFTIFQVFNQLYSSFVVAIF